MIKARYIYVEDIPMICECPKCGAELYYSMSNKRRWTCSDSKCKYNWEDHERFIMSQMVMKYMCVRVNQDTIRRFCIVNPETIV